MDEEEMMDLFSDGVQSIRMNYYPPCPVPEKTIGFSPHSDADALTVLFQLNETDGLQVRKDSIWVPVKPLPNALIVNIGDILVTTFYSSNLYSRLGPAHSLIGPKNPPIFRRVPVEKYFKDFFARKLDGKSYIDFVKEEARDEKT
ncbi:hypothetical protein HAX54_042966 [Datura stramonium]|uniref:Fe2OG dioxygenase domain-containing protein n=1 Tax=Datura stramonium TaxID=4076 RepID=A0ABS8SN49_DATST|nr:hypothetical protein [Datura stramonium]